jgi:hypothetical protein
MAKDKYQPKGWHKKRDGSGGFLGGKHVQPEPRDPRPKGAQRGVVRRDGQGPANFGNARGIWR